MIEALPRNIIRFFILVLLQVLVFNNMELDNAVQPYIYTLFILLLPFETPGWVLLLTGFSLGFSIDVFSETLGMHTIATTTMAFLRPYVLTVISPRDGYETSSLPRVHYYGLSWFIKYALILLIAHHLVLFIVEIFRFQDMFRILLHTIFSSVFTLIFIVLSQFFVFRK